jgi:hypothetical protein
MASGAMPCDIYSTCKICNLQCCWSFAFSGSNIYILPIELETVLFELMAASTSVTDIDSGIVPIFLERSESVISVRKMAWTTNYCSALMVPMVFRIPPA